MAEAENELRREIQKVYDRALERARAEGRPDAEAHAHADEERKRFMEKWDIRPDMLGPPPPAIRHSSGPQRQGAASSAGFMGMGLAEGEGRPGGGAAAKAAYEARLAREAREAEERGKQPVDLGSSPLRTAVPMPTGKTKLSDLLSRHRTMKADQEAASGASAFQTPGPLAGPLGFRRSPPPAVPPGTRLNDLLSRVQGGRPGASPASRPSAAPPPEPPKPIRIGPVREHRRVVDEPPPPDPYGRVAAAEEIEGGAGGEAPAPLPPATEDRENRRRAILDEFDRTYERVLAMVESRIEMIDLAVGDGNGSPPSPRAPAPAEMISIAEDLDHLLGDLQRMSAVCEALIGRLGQYIERFPPPGAEAGGDDGHPAHGDAAGGQGAGQR